MSIYCQVRENEDRIMNIKRFTIITLSFLSASYIYGASAGTSAGLTLLEAPGARAAALGEAYSAAPNDIAGFGYNPALLSTLKTGQASFLFQKGVFEDSYGQVMIGSPYSKGGLGLSVGYYNGGDLDILDGSTERTVSAQRDINVALGSSFKFGRVSIGITGKYISSELAETAKATAFAGDFGLSLPVSSRLQWGAAVQNLGTKLTFVEVGDNLPRVARTGIAWNFAPGKLSTSLLVDGSYLMNEREFRPAAGLEMWVGPLALRAGYKGGSDLENFSFGSGFILGPSSLDYSFGLVDKLDPRHRVSLSFQFGGTSPAVLVQKPISPPQQPARMAFEIKEEEKEVVPTVPAVAEDPVITRHTLGGTSSSGLSASRRVYIVKPGDSLATIAKRVYGKTGAWKTIFNANKTVLLDPEALEPGQKIYLP